MQRTNLSPGLLASALGLAMLTAFSCASGSAHSALAHISTEAPFTFDANRNLIRPQNYRSWVYVGTPVTPNDMNNGKAPFPEFHNVYVDPAAFAHWQERGEWRDGTILVKELVSVGGKQAVSGKGYFMGDFIGLEATVKSRTHFPGEPGNWAYFSFTGEGGGTLKSEAAAFPTKSCNACHAASAADDFVFTQYYPVLTAAKRSGSAAENTSMRARMAMSPPPTNTEWQPRVATPASVDGAPPLGRTELFAFLQQKQYRKFPGVESKAHSGRGPHTELGNPVRVYTNKALTDSLAANHDEHPAGSTAVKEMFGKSGELQGWAVMVKTAPATADGDGWFWYEVTSTQHANATPAMGNGVPGCVQCHAVGQDLILTRFPLR